MAWVVVTPPIIIRHDVPDSEYLALAREASGLVHLNLPDGEGVLIAPQWVLTAAHVAVELEFGDVLSIVGDGGYLVAETFIHPDWVDGGPHDIALVRLSTASETPPVPLYPDRDEVGRLVLVVGAGDFGTGLTGPTGNDGRVRAATNRVDSASEYWLRWVFHDPSDPEATELEGISGPGDSGGPAYIVRDGVRFVAGISAGQSTRATGGREGLYGVTEFYTRVSSYQSWITEKIGSR